MRFLANENFPALSIALLRTARHPVRSIREEAQGAKDTEVLELARSEGAIIITLDKDYGELIFKHGVPEPPAVLFLRYRGRDPLAPSHLVLELLAGETRLEGCFTVLEVDGIRQRRYR